jgi:hypothetical protein
MAIAPAVSAESIETYKLALERARTIEGTYRDPEVFRDTLDVETIYPHQINLVNVDQHDFCIIIISVPIPATHINRIFSNQTEPTVSAESFFIIDELNLLCMGRACLCFPHDWFDYNELHHRSLAASTTPKKHQDIHRKKNTLYLYSRKFRVVILF